MIGEKGDRSVAARNERHEDAVSHGSPQQLGAAGSTAALQPETREIVGRAALALSGGGFRAALFHLGLLRRIAELGRLPEIRAISGVSGGSILAAFAGLHWTDVLAAGGYSDALCHYVVDPFVEVISGRNLFREWAVRLPFTMHRRLHDPAFSRTVLLGELIGGRLYGNAACIGLPEYPYIILNATSLPTIRAWRFTRDGLGDSLIGYASWNEWTLPLGAAVAASAAFPPVFSPTRIWSSRYHFGGPVYGEEPINLPASIPLTDGGVYENQGTEVLIKETPLPGGRTLVPSPVLIVSDAGYPAHRQFSESRIPAVGSFKVLRRANDILLAQTSSLRRRMLVKDFERHEYTGLLVNLGSTVEKVTGSRVEEYRAVVGREFCLPVDVVHRLHKVRTHLNRFSKHEAELLMYHGYLLTDAVLWANADYLPPDFRRPDLPLQWRIAQTPEFIASSLERLERSDRLV